MKDFPSMKLNKIAFLCFLLAFSIQCHELTAQENWPNMLPMIQWGDIKPAVDEIPPPPLQWPSTEVIDHYFIDNSHPLATDDDNGFGFPDKPRMTIPQTSFNAGSYIQIAGGPYQVLSGSLQFNLSFNGTEEAPCWMFCFADNPVEIQGEVNIDGSYLIIDGFYFDRNVVTDKKTEVEFTRSNNICLRNARIKDDGTFHPGFGAGVNINGEPDFKTKEIIIFNCEIRDLDDPEYSIHVDEDDNNGILAGQHTENIYIVSNSIFNCAGDGVVTNGNFAMGDARAKNVFVVNNEIYGNGENAFDIKSGRDVIIAENKIHGYVDSQGSDGTAIVVQQEGGDGSDNVWILFNEIYDSELSVRVEEQASNCYVIGNIIRDQRSSYSSTYVRTNTAELSLIDNTIVRYSSIGFRWDDLPRIDCHGNIFGLRQDPGGYELRASTANENILLDYNLYDNSTDLRLRFMYPVYTTLAEWQLSNPQAWDNNSLYSEASFSNVSADDFSIDLNSTAIDANVEHPAYDTFFERYQIDIKRDFLGIVRPQGAAWDIGAFEYSDEILSTEQAVLATAESNFILYPNPSTGSIKSNEGQIIAIYSALGQKLGGPSIIETLGAGNYLAEVQNGDISKLIPFVKI